MAKGERFCLRNGKSPERVRESFPETAKVFGNGKSETENGKSKPKTEKVRVKVFLYLSPFGETIHR
jgi:hypothetical protein